MSKKQLKAEINRLRRKNKKLKKKNAELRVGNTPVKKQKAWVAFLS